MTKDALSVLEEHNDDIEAVCLETLSLREEADSLQNKVEELQKEIDNHECE